MATSTKHVSEVRNVDPKILDAFWKLVDVDDKIRLAAAEKILVILKRKQESFEGENDCPDVSYCLERLVRGLSSTRKAARQGFTIVLTQVLKYEQVSLDKYFKLTEKHIPLTANQQDVAPAVIGRALAYGALIRSGRLKSDLEMLKTTFNTLRKLCFHRPYVEQVCSALLLELFSQIDDKQFRELIWPVIKEELNCGWSACTPEQLFLILAVYRHYPNVVNKKFLSLYWGNEEVIHANCYEDLGKVLKKSTSAHPLIHSVCDEVLRNVLNETHFKQFWNKVVNEMLLQSGQDEKVYLGFQLLKMVLPQLKTEKHAAIVLSPTFHRTLTKAAFNHQHTLNCVALEICEFLGSFIAQCQDSNVQLLILKIFVLPPGSIFFDHITKKKILANIVQSLHPDVVHYYAELLKSLFLESENKQEEQKEDADNDVDTQDPQRAFALHQLVNIVRHPAMESNMEWQQGIVEFVLVYGFFNVESSFELPHCSVKPTSLTESLQQTCQELFYKALETYCQSKKPTSTKTRLQCEAETLKEIGDVVMSLFTSTESVSLLVPKHQVPIVIKAWKTMQKTISTLKKKVRKGNLDENSAFQLLFYFVGLQLLVDPESSQDALQELQECYKHAYGVKPLSDKSETALDEPLWSEVLVDLMLSLLPNVNRVIRSCLSLVFSSLISHITNKSLQQILDVVNPSPPADDAEPVLEDDGGDEGKDGEMETSSTESTDDENKSTSSIDDEEEEEDDESVDKEFRKKVKLALGDAAVKSDDDSETYLSDSEMMKLDKSIAEAFREHLGANPKFSKRESDLLTFRLRCLDFIIIYLKSSPRLSGALLIIKPLLAAARYGVHHQTQSMLKVKAIGTLELLLKCKKFDISNVSSLELTMMFRYLTDEAKKSTNAELSKVISHLCAWVVSVNNKVKNKLAGDGDNDASTQECYLSLYKQCLDDHFTKSNTDTPKQMFVSLLSVCPESSMFFIQCVQKYALSENIRIFKRIEALGLLSMALNSYKSSKIHNFDKWKCIIDDLVPKLSEVLLQQLKEKTWKRQYVSDLLQVLFLVCDISESLYQLHPLESYPHLSHSLVEFPRSKKRLLLRQSQAVIKKLTRMIKGNPKKGEGKAE